MKKPHPRRLMMVAGLATAAGLATYGLSEDEAERSARALLAEQQAAARAAFVHDPIRAVSLAEVRASGTVPAAFADTIPVDLTALSIDDKKATFFKIILPLIARENGRIRDERKHVTGAAAAVPEYLWEKYDVKIGDMETLRRRVDIIPASMILAQAALESGWGTSRFAVKGNNLFGMRSYNPETPGITPKEADGFEVIKYATLSESLGHYLLNLNTHQAYKELRQVRAAMRARGEDPDSRKLAKRLTQYSEIPNKYGDLLHQIIDGDHLEEFDGLRLSGSS